MVDKSTKKRKRQGQAPNDPVSARFANEYLGYAPRARGETLPRERYGFLAPDEFHSRYVEKRQPVVLTHTFDDESELASASTWTDEFLRQRCGAGSKVRMELREGGRFGCGVYRDVTFDEFMDLFSNGDSGVYLSAGGKSETFAAPARRLFCAGDAKSAREKGLLPLRPSAMPESLVPADINLWMGRAAKGEMTSSGLHHDFHDNLYVLVRGEKHFKLYAPRDAGKMYTNKDIRWVHENGLINYKCFPSTLQDGDVALEDGETALERRVRKARLVDANIDDDESDADDEPGFGEGHDDFDDDVFDGVDDFDELEESISADSSSGDGGTADEEDDGSHTSDGGAKKVSRDTCDPASFSRVEYDKLEKYPLFKSATCIEVTVRAGEALYLPAGWFHDVSSGETSAAAGHCAVNYWFNPPPLGEEWGPRRALWEEDFKRSVVDKIFRNDGEAAT